MNIIRVQSSLLLIVLSVLLSVLVIAPAQAGSANFSLSSGSRKINTGTTFSVPIKVYPNGASIDTARVVLNFNPTVLRATEFKFTSELKTQAPASFIDNDKGLISWGGFDMQGRINAPTVFGLVTFKAIAEGQGQVALAPSSKLISGGEDVSNPNAYNQIQVAVVASPRHLASASSTSTDSKNLPPEYNYQLPSTNFVCASVPSLCNTSLGANLISGIQILIIIVIVMLFIFRRR